MKAFCDEIKYLQQLRHPGVLRILAHGECKVNGDKTKYYTSEYVQGTRLDKFFNEHKDEFYRDTSLLGAIATSILEALDYCHSKNVLHLDIKPDNILVQRETSTGNPRCILIDFGKSKQIYNANKESKDKTYTTVSPVVAEYVHPDLIPYLRKNIVSRDIYADGAQKYDLYSVGVIIKKYLIPANIAKIRRITDERSFMRLLASKLENPGNGETFLAGDGVKILRRSVKRDMSQTEKIRLSGMSSVTVDHKVMGLIDSREFQRLRHVRQLGLSDFVYPKYLFRNSTHLWNLGVTPGSKFATKQNVERRPPSWSTV